MIDAKKCSGVTKSIAKSDIQGIPDGEALSQGVTKGVTRGVTIVQKDSRTDPTDPTDSTDMARKENIENPTLMTQAYGPKCWPSTIVPESKLSHIVQAHHGFGYQTIVITRGKTVKMDCRKRLNRFSRFF